MDRPAGFKQTLDQPFVFRTRLAAKSTGNRLGQLKRIWRYKEEERSNGGWYLRVFDTSSDKAGRYYLYTKSQGFKRTGNLGQFALAAAIARKQSENMEHSDRVRLHLGAARRALDLAIQYAKEDKAAQEIAA